MSLSNPRILFGIHSISPYNRSSRMPYGILKVIGSANLALSSSIEQLFAGSNKFAWAAEAKTVTSELTAKVKAYPGFLFELFLGATVTDAGADSAGSVANFVDNFGGSVKDASTGIATLTVIPSTGAANLKFGQYVLKATSTTAVKVYLMSDVDAKRGTDAPYVDDTLEVSGPHTVTSGANTDIAALGLRLGGGSGSIALVVGDTASFSVLPPSSKSSAVVVGSSDTTFPNFGALLMAQKRATGELFEIDALNCIASGLPIDLTEQAFSQPEIKMSCLYDSAQDAVFHIRHLLPE